MKLKSIFIVIFLCFCVVKTVFAGGSTYEWNAPWNYSYYETDSTHLNLINLLTSGGPFYTSGFADFEEYSGPIRLFIYPSSSEDYIFYKNGFNALPGSSGTFSKEFSGYTTTEISNGKCIIDLIPTQTENRFKVSSNLNVLSASEIPITNYQLIDNLLKKYYYMKADIKATLYKNGNPTTTVVYPIEYVSSRAGYSNFVEVKPNDYGMEINFNFPTITYESHGAGSYYWNITAEPIDKKCPEFGPEVYIKTNEFTVSKPVNELEPYFTGSFQKLYDVTCEGEMFFDDFTWRMSCTSSGTRIENSTEFYALGADSCSQGFSTASYSMDYILNNLNDNKDGYYYCVYDDGDCSGSGEPVKGFCKVTYNGPESSSEFSDVLILPSNELVHSQGSRRKVQYDFINKKAYFINKGMYLEEIAVPPTDNNKKIKIMKNGVNIRNDTIRPEIIALKSHNIKNFANSANATKFVVDSYNLMKKLNITKELNTTIPGKTRIKINLEIPSSQRTNLTIYQVIPKSMLDNIDKINFIDNSTAQVIVLEKDPVIGFYFNESGGDESVEYELPGESEGGTIIITQEPILFNEGELIINYRETDCNPDEAQLFELDDLIDSKVYSAGSGKAYKVCVAHLSEDLEANSNNLYRHIFNYTNAGNVSLTQMMNIPVDISVDNSTRIYWDLELQKDNPTGNYSCLGSVANYDNSLFGDCGYTTKRIWIHLGKDIIPPNTTLSYPYIAHKMKIVLDAEDNIGGSGLDETFYCVEEGGVDCLDSGDFKLFDGDYFLVTCSEDWGCVKNIHYYSTDVEGNKEPTNVYELTLIDKGSACQVDCTAKPKPNRYLKECRNLNGCEFYPAPWESGDERGAYVAQQCHFMTENSWVAYNSTHEIQCPIGPLRPAMFTSLKTLITSLTCEDVTVIERSVLINGESVKMKIVFCGDDLEQ